MAVKEATDEGGKESEKTEPAVAQVSASGNRNLILIIAAVAIAAVLAIVIFFVASQEAPDGGGTVIPGDGDTVVDPGDGSAGGMSFDEIALKTLEADKEIEKVVADVSVTMEVGGDAAQGQEVAMEIDAKVEYDAANKRIYTKSTTSAAVAGLAGPQVVESYMIDNIVYTKVEDPYGVQDYWMKQSLGYDLWAVIEEIDPSEIVDLVDGQVLGTETKDGKETYKLAVEPDMGALIEYSMSMYDIGELGVTAAEMDELMGMLVDSIERADFTAWVSKEDYKVMAIEGEIDISFDIGALAGAPGMGTVELMMELSADMDYDSPVDIQLPAAALDAIDADQGTGSYCGDGWCDDLYGTEDADSCPTDCYCGNIICELTEDEESCPEDCTSVCGDGWCDFDETPETCEEDCYCGNQWCDDSEDSEACPEDCYCGDFWCDPAEDGESCPEDCEIVTI